MPVPRSAQGAPSCEPPYQRPRLVAPAPPRYGQLPRRSTAVCSRSARRTRADESIATVVRLNWLQHARTDLQCAEMHGACFARTTSGVSTGHPSLSWLATTSRRPSLAALRSTHVTGVAAAHSGTGLTCFFARSIGARARRQLQHGSRSPPPAPFARAASRCRLQRQHR